MMKKEISPAKKRMSALSGRDLHIMENIMSPYESNIPLEKDNQNTILSLSTLFAARQIESQRKQQKQTIHHGLKRRLNLIANQPSKQRSKPAIKTRECSVTIARTNSAITDSDATIT